MRIGIIITAKNLVDYTAAAIESIATSHPFALILVDDWSNDGTKEYFKMVEANNDRVILITDPLTDSLAGKWNLGVEQAWEVSCEVVLVCNNDIMFSPQTIDALVARIEKGDVGMVTAHNIRGELKQPHEILTWEVNYPTSEAPHPDFSCFMMTKDTWEKVGKFDENFKPSYFEDSDFHIRLGKAGVKAIRTTAAPYFHWGSMTQNSVPGGICPGPQFDRLREYLRSKHGTVPGEAEYERLCQLPFTTPEHEWLNVQN